MQLDELFVALVFKTDDKEVKEFDKTVKSTKTNMLGLVLGAVAVVAALDKIAQSTANAVNNLQNFNSQTGLSIGKLQNLQITAGLQNIGLSAEQVSQSVQTLQSNLASIKLGQGNIAPFQMLGIDVMGQNAFGILDQLRERIKGLDDMTATNMIQQMGLNPQFISVLRMSKDEFAGLNSQIALTYDERQNIQALGVEIKKTELLIEGAINKAIAKWSPALIGLAQFIQNINFAINKLHLLLPILLIGMGGILKMFNLLKASTLGWTMALTWLMLLLDDYATWSKGGQSLFDYTGMEKFFDAIDKNLNKLDKHANLLNGIFQLANVGTGAGIGARLGGLFGVPGAAIGAGAGALVGVGVNMAMDNAAKEGGATNVHQTNNINVNSNASNGPDVARSLQQPLNSATQQLINQTGGR